MNLRPYIGNYISSMTKMCNIVLNPVDMFGMVRVPFHYLVCMVSTISFSQCDIRWKLVRTCSWILRLWLLFLIGRQIANTTVHHTNNLTYFAPSQKYHACPHWPMEINCWRYGIYIYIYLSQALWLPTNVLKTQMNTSAITHLHSGLMPSRKFNCIIMVIVVIYQ
jgi:hypothetical protein